MVSRQFFRQLFGGNSTAKRENCIRPTIEVMEERSNPANVTATIANGVLTLTAATGNFDDVMKISQSSIEGQYDIAGTGTTINGVTIFTTTKPWNSVVCNLKGGNDEVTLSTSIVGGMTFNGGDGNNEFTIDSGSYIGGSVRYGNGTANANVDKLTIFANDIFIARDLIGNFGAGTSYTTLAGVVVGGRVAITGGSGNDSIETLGIHVCQSFTANLGNGSNLVSIDALGDNISGGADGTDILGGLTINTGTGADTINIGSEHGVEVLGKVVMNTGNEAAGGDSIAIDNSTFYGDCTLNLGAGNDTVLFETIDNLNSSGKVYGLLTVLGQAGDDAIGFGQTTGARTMYLGKSPKLDGGAGVNDQLLLIDLAILNTKVVNLSLFNPSPVNFEATVF